MQIHAIVQSLKDITSNTPALATLLPGNLHHGTDASIDAPRPFGLLNVVQTESIGNSSGVRLVSYLVTLTVIVDERVTRIGNILDVFSGHWSRITSLPSLDPDLARFVAIAPTDAELGETEDENLGKDTLLGVTAWELKLSEHSPALE